LVFCCKNCSSTTVHTKSKKDVLATQRRGENKKPTSNKMSRIMKKKKKEKKVRPNGNGARAAATPHEIVMAFPIVISYLKP
jgi:hypothetical protein